METKREIDGEMMIIGALIIVVFVMMIRACHDEYRESEDWKKFQIDHKCKVIGYSSAQYRTPAKTGYLCDDGLQYWNSY